MKTLKKNDSVGKSLDEVLTMKKLLTKIRAYGWYCPRCRAHKDIEQVNVVKVVGSRYMTMICTDCNTELIDCFLLNNTNERLKQFRESRDCEGCTDRFRCYTRSDAVIEKELKSMKSHEIKTYDAIIDTRHIEGVRSYTGIYNQKLDSEFCAFPERDDCNHSWMRQNYSGSPYKRCVYMKYDATGKFWYCWYGKRQRGEI